MTTKKELLEKIAELQAKVDAMPDDEPEHHVFFYPEKGGVCWRVSHSITGAWEAYKEKGDPECDNGLFIRTEEQAELIAWSIETLWKFASYGVPIEDGVKQWVVDAEGLHLWSEFSNRKAVYQTVFPTEERAKKALAAIGGIDNLNKARAGIVGNVIGEEG